MNHDTIPNILPIVIANMPEPQLRWIETGYIIDSCVSLDSVFMGDVELPDEEIARLSPRKSMGGLGETVRRCYDYAVSSGYIEADGHPVIELELDDVCESEIAVTISVDSNTGTGSSWGDWECHVGSSKLEVDPFNRRFAAGNKRAYMGIISGNSIRFIKIDDVSSDKVLEKTFDKLGNSGLVPIFVLTVYTFVQETDRWDTVNILYCEKVGEIQ